MLEVAREYITAIRIKAVASDDPKRSSELAAFLTHCNMQPAHLLLVLRSAMVTCFKHKNFILAASFSRRLLELPDINSQKNAELKSKAGKVLNKVERFEVYNCDLFIKPAQYAESILKKSNTTLVGPSPAPGSWMHRLRRSMPLWRLRNSASLAGGLVGALHVFLCFFHADFWQEGEQK